VRRVKILDGINLYRWSIGDVRGKWIKTRIFVVKLCDIQKLSRVANEFFQEVD